MAIIERDVRTEMGTGKSNAVRKLGDDFDVLGHRADDSGEARL